MTAREDAGGGGGGDGRRRGRGGLKLVGIECIYKTLFEHHLTSL